VTFFTEVTAQTTVPFPRAFSPLPPEQQLKSMKNPANNLQEKSSQQPKTPTAEGRDKI